MAGIGHIILNVSDFEFSEEFYDKLTDLLEFRHVYQESEEWGKTKAYNCNGLQLWIRHDNRSEHKEFVRDVGLDHLAFIVDSRKDVDLIYETIKGSGTKITRKPRVYPEYGKDYYAFYFRDPDGIPLEIYCDK